MNETVTQTIGGILVVKTKSDSSLKTTRYIDGAQGLILDVLEEYQDKTILTKYKSNGLQPQCIEISTKNKKTTYQGDGKTLIFVQETGPNLIKTTHFQTDGKTIEKIKMQEIEGVTKTFYYQEDGITPLKLVEMDIEGMTKTTVYDQEGKNIISIQEDLADGSILKTFYRTNGIIEKTHQSHIKGLLKNDIKEIIYDSTGKKKLSEKIISTQS